jgi:4-amino-4-deoxy-L-arabinose transferase-like glycosyltransferase
LLSNAPSRLTLLLEDPLLPCLLLFAWVLISAWIRPLGMPDEGRYTGVAWEMVRSGHWLTPTLDGLPYFHKPPLFYWLTAISIQLFGTSELALRVAPMLGATLIAFAGFRLLRRWASLSVAHGYLIVLGTMPYFYGGAQFANHDMLVAAFISAAIVFAADALLSSDANMPWKFSMLLAWACIALGLLSKGLIGIVLPGGVIFFWILLQRRWQWLVRLLWWPGPLVFLLIAAPWFVLMQQAFPQFFHYFFIHQHFERFAETSFNNVQPWWFYPTALALLCLPWTFALAGRVKLPAADGARAALRQLLWLWLIVIVVFFSLPASKLVGYALPAVPAIAMLVAEVVAERSLRWRSLPVAMAVITAISLVTVIYVLGRNDPYSSKPLATAWREQAAPGEPLISLGVYRFDFPLYGKVPEPMPVLMDWSDPAIVKRDSWPRELADAARFDPKAGQHVLVNQSELPAMLCAQAVTWIITAAKENRPPLALADTIATTSYYKLLRFDRERNMTSCKDGLKQD